MKKNSIDNKLENDLDVLNKIFEVLKLTSKHYIKTCEKFNITQIQFELLYLLYISIDNGVKMSTLGDKLGIARPRVTLLVDKMELAGLVKRLADVEDRRIIKVMITEKGNEIMGNAFSNNGIFKVSILDFIQQDEKELLYKLIIKIKENLEREIAMI